MTDPGIPDAAAPPARSFHTPSPSIGMSEWLRQDGELIAGRWLAELAARDARDRGKGGDLLDSFIPFLVSFLPVSMGPFRDPAEPLWKQAAELYGNVAAMRGLAAGEVIEEFQFLREALIRRLAERSTRGGGWPGLRDVLLLNRTVDLGVTHSSIGHTDALFFALFHGTGVPRALSPDILDEVGSQMAGLRAELLRLERP